MTDLHDPTEGRITDYLRSRADVDVPDGTIQAAVARIGAGDVSSGGFFRRGLIGTLAAVVVLAAAIILFAVALRPSLDQSPDETAPGVAASVQPTNQQPTPGLPTENGMPAILEGLPVQTVASTLDLLGAGELDGRAAAVAGYYFEFHPSCPAPGGYVDPLDNYCRIVAFGDSEDAARICSFRPNSVSCNASPGDRHGLVPEFMSETAGYDSLRFDTEGHPAHVVLIGHAADPRLWQCREADDEACRRAFVIDRIAWVDGRDVLPTAPQTYDPVSQTVVRPEMSLAEVARSVGEDQTIVAAGPYRASDVASIDPRFNMTGEEVVWIVRSYSAGEWPSSESTRPLTVSLVDDASGQVLATRALNDASFEPARLWLRGSTTEHDAQSNPPQDEAPFFRVEQLATTIFDGSIGGTRYGTADMTRYGPSVPLVVEPGTYDISAWWANNDGSMDRPDRNCSTEIALRVAEDAYLSADFSKRGACSITPFPSSQLDYY